MKRLRLVDWLGYVALTSGHCTRAVPLRWRIASAGRVSWPGGWRAIFRYAIYCRRKSADDLSRHHRASTAGDARSFLGTSATDGVCEIAHCPRKIHRNNWRDHFYLRDKPLMLRTLMNERPTILVTGHFGNFELAGFATGLFGVPSHDDCPALG